MPAPKTLLLVDDDADILAAMLLVFGRLGYRVLTAADGSAGIAVAEREKPDVVVVDMMMPKQSGFVVLDTLKRDRTEAPRVVMITANTGNQHRAYARMMGADDYLHKPFTMDTLVESVRRLCDGGPP
jgi:DNA-binding response OmpR family regulator